MQPPQHEIGRQPGGVGTLGRTLAFVVANMVLSTLLFWDAARDGRGGGVNIGAGFAILLVTVVAAAVWGGMDGRRCRDATQLVVRWGIVAVVASLVTPTYQALVLEQLSVQDLLSAEWGITPLAASFIFVPAVVSGVNALRARPKALAASR
jgi:hypothetical protein